MAATDASVRAYNELLEALEERLAPDLPPSCPVDGTPLGPYGSKSGDFPYWCAGCGAPVHRDAAVRVTPPTRQRKAARQAARSVLPNATETRIVVTGNYRAWRHFIGMRATEHADVEIRDIAVEVLRQLQRVAPNVFADFTITRLPDGSEVASSPYGERA